VHQSDGGAGQVLAALEAPGFAGVTIVILISDNRPEHDAYPRVRRFGHRSMGPLRGLARDFWEGGDRVPGVIRWPGMVEPGRVSNALVHDTRRDHDALRSGHRVRVDPPSGGITRVPERFAEAEGYSGM
jgi:arylsulfatase A-like enzyme